MFAFELDKKKHRWKFTQKITSPDGIKEDSRFGTSIALRHDLALISASSPPLITSSNNGTVYVYHRKGKVWHFVQKIIGDQMGPTPPNSFVEFTIGDGFGNSLALDKNFAVVGAGREAQSTTMLFRGAVYFYRINWQEDGTPSLQFQQKFFSDSPTSQITGGFSLVVKDRTAFVGDPERTGPAGIFQGGVMIFKYKNGKWRQVTTLFNPHGEAFSCFGASISLHKSHLLVGQDPTAMFSALIPGPVPAPFPTSSGKALIFNCD